LRKTPICTLVPSKERPAASFMANLETYWPEILDVVRQKVPQQTFNTWFLPLQPENTENGSYGVACPNHFFMDWFSEHHLTVLNEAGSAYFGKSVVFSLQVGEKVAHVPGSVLAGLTSELDEGLEKPEKLPSEPNKPARNAISAAAVLNVGPLNLDLDSVTGTEINTSISNLNPDYNFANFVIGSGTDLAFAAATAIANNPGSHFNPLFIHGGTGLGKTHLMQAIGNEIGRQHPHKKICYVTAEHFMNDLIGSIRDNRTPDFKLKYRSVDVLLVDDVAFLAGKESTQEEFFHT
jgi:chromosomal replication initiator protein